MDSRIRIGHVLAAFLFCGSGIAAAQDGARYCADLKRVIATGKENPQFGSIAGARLFEGGSSLITNVTLAGWPMCSILQPDNRPESRIYGCQSTAVDTEAAAGAALTKTVGEVAACLGSSWKQNSQKVGDAQKDLVSFDEGEQSNLYVSLSADKDFQDKFVVYLVVAKTN
jgi:hypothetical protein